MDSWDEAALISPPREQLLVLLVEMPPAEDRKPAAVLLDGRAVKGRRRKLNRRWKWAAVMAGTSLYALLPLAVVNGLAQRLPLAVAPRVGLGLPRAVAVRLPCTGCFLRGCRHRWTRGHPCGGVGDN